MLKNLLSLLLSKFYSKQESALVANQAMPGNSKIEITATSAPGDWQTVATYTAPCAGIASLRGQAINNTAFMQIMLEAGEPGKESPSITGFATTGQYPHIWLNVKKGDQIVFKAGAITQVFARFFKTVGGGYKDIIWRAVLCLNSYSNFYLKHSLEIKNRGFRQLIRRIGMETSRLTFNHYRITNLTIISKGMYRQLMALLSTQVPESLSSFVYKPKDFSLCMLADTTLWLFESIKEKQYFYKRKILKNFVDSYRLERTNKVTLGGAL